MAVPNILPTIAPILSSLGWGQIGSLLGSTYDWYPITSTNNPLDYNNNQGSFQCYFDRDPTFPARKAAEFGKPEYFVAYDRAGPGIGDYLVEEVDDGSTPTVYFIADQEDLTPSKVLRCQKTVSFYRAGPVSNTGGIATATIGDMVSDDGPADPAPYQSYEDRDNGGLGTLLAASWPIAMMPGTKGEKDALNLPQSTRMPWVDIKCPQMPGVTLLTGDLFVDEIGALYKISLALPDLNCWHLTAEYEGLV